MVVRAASGGRGRVQARYRSAFKVKAAIDLVDHQKLYGSDHGETLETERLVRHILAAFLERDKSFQASRKSAPAGRSSK